MFADGDVVLVLYGYIKCNIFEKHFYALSIFGFCRKRHIRRTYTQQVECFIYQPRRPDIRKVFADRIINDDNLSRLVPFKRICK